MKLSVKERQAFQVILVVYLLGLVLFLPAIIFSWGEEKAPRRSLNTPMVKATNGQHSSSIKLVQIPSPTPAIAAPTIAAPIITEPAPTEVPAISSFDTGFEVPVNGFAFQNYDSRFPEGDLTIDQVRTLFGDEVCAQIKGDKCLPNPAAQFWIDQMNKAMKGGHCVGFTILSQRFVEGKYSPTDFSEGANSAFDLTQNVAVMRQIAQDWVLQVTDEVLQATVSGTPREIVDELLALQQAVDLGIFHRKGGGHSMLAYGVKDQGNGIFHILLYDNNWPGRDDLFVEVDVNANTWRYSLAATNPNEDAKAWEGDARTKSLMFVPLDAYEQNVSCPFCFKSPTTGAAPRGALASLAPQAAQGKNIVMLSGDDGHLKVSNSKDQQVGWSEDQYINEIPGAQLIRLRGHMFNKAEPYLIMPAEQNDFDINVTAREGQTGRANLRMIGPNISFAIDNLLLSEQQTESMAVSTTEQQITYKPSGPQRPVFKLVIEQVDGGVVTFSVTGAEFQSGESFSFGVDPQSGQLDFAGDRQEDLSLVIAKVGAVREPPLHGTAIFVADELAIPEGEAPPSMSSFGMVVGRYKCSSTRMAMALLIRANRCKMNRLAPCWPI